MKLVMISEIFRKADEASEKEQKINILRQNATPTMRIIVEGAFHSNLRWLITKGPITYRPQPSNEAYGALHAEAPRLYRFVEKVSNPEQTPVLPQWKREKMFIAVLETVHRDDAVILLSMKDKTLPYPTLTYELFEEAFPDWLPSTKPLSRTPFSVLKDFFDSKKEEKVDVNTEEVRIKKGKGQFWFNNGSMNKRFFLGEEPEGWSKGLLHGIGK